MTSIKSHLERSHPVTFQKLIQLNLNEYACIYCKNESNCKDTMQIHLALLHPDKPAFVIQRTLQFRDREDAVEDLILLDISIHVLETDIAILEDREINSKKDEEMLDRFDIGSKQLETFTNSKQPTVMPLKFPTKSCRSTDECAINQTWPSKEQLSETRVTNIQIRSPLRPMKLKNMEHTPQTIEYYSNELSDSVTNTEILKAVEIEKSQSLDDIMIIRNLDIHPIIKPGPHSMKTESPIETVQPISTDHKKLAHLENTTMEVDLKTTSDNFSEAVLKNGDRIKCLIELLVENTGIHASTLYRCPHCSSSFSHVELWLTHLKIKHKCIGDVLCPYCTKQFSLESAESHFKSHLRHEYICYYCIASFCSKEKIQEHFAICHENCSTIEKPIASFYFVIKQDAIISDYTALLEHFAEELYSHLTKKLLRNTVHEWTVGLTDACLDDMEIPQYKPERQPLFKCFVKLCPFVGLNENSLDNHLAEHELPTSFECTYCMFRITNSDWESMKCHHLQHQSTCIHICCVCKFVHYNNEGVIKHIENLHNSRDVPVLCLVRGELNLNYKVSLSIFLPPNKINFATSKACFCCSEELRNSNKYLYHLKKVHKLSFCPRCQLCGKIILTHLDAEAHHKDYHQKEKFNLKYEVLTTYLYNLVLKSRSPFKMELRPKKEKSCNQIMDSNRIEYSSVAVKEEVLVKTELEECNKTQSISLKCLHTNQLLENDVEKNKFQQDRQQSNNFYSTYSAHFQRTLVNHEIQHSAAEEIIINNSTSIEQNLAPSTQQHHSVNTRMTSSTQEHVQPSTSTRYSVPLPIFPHQQAISNEFSLLPRTTICHSTPNIDLQFSLSSQSQNIVTHEAPCSYFTLPNCVHDSLSSSRSTQQVVINEIQLPTGNVVLSIPLETSSAEQRSTELDSHRIPVTTANVPQPNIPGIAMVPARSPIIQEKQTEASSVTSVQVNQVNRPNLDEIVPICGTCYFECIDFIHLQAHYEETHASYNEGFYFYVDRKIGCMNCHFRGSVSSFAHHHAILHGDKAKLCYSVVDPTRCGMCNDIFRYPSSGGHYTLPRFCSCPGRQRTLSDCLNLPILKSLQDVGYQYYRYSCDICRLSFQSQQQFVHHFASVHHQYLDPEVWRSKLRYYCCMCPSMVSYNIFDVIYHMKFSHLKALTGLTMFQRFGFYKKIRIAHPNGLLISLDDLHHTGQFDVNIFKKNIYTFESQYV